MFRSYATSLRGRVSPFQLFRSYVTSLRGRVAPFQLFPKSQYGFTDKLNYLCPCWKSNPGFQVFIWSVAHRLFSSTRYETELIVLRQLVKSKCATLDHTKFLIRENGVGIVTYYWLMVPVSNRGGDNRFAAHKSVPKGREVHSAFCTKGAVVLP